ncbi:Putative sulfonate ABC transporter, periplasmic protein [Mycobacteroides abscessus subsp. abscessus]|nr:Putative sulfonate ABC transporter, periplasmic protein [Mycobacteroides abscessus subsp. abscessus]
MSHQKSRRISRRTALWATGGTVAAGGSLASAAALGRASGKEAAGVEVGGALKIGYLPITDSAPLLLAHKQGLYTQHGISVAKPVMFRSWSSLTEAFISGTVDVIHLLMPMAVYLKYDVGADAQIVAWNHVNGSAFTVAPSIVETAQLAGKTVAIPGWFSIHNILVQKILREAGLTPVIRKTADTDRGEVALVVMAPSDMIPALANGTIAGFTVADPFNAAAVASKVGRIHRFMGDVWRDHACCVTLMRGSLIEQHSEVAQNFTNALVEAQIFAREHRKEAANILSDNFLPQKPKAIERAMTDHLSEHRDAVKNPSWGGQLLQFQPYPYASFTEDLVVHMRETLMDAPTDFLNKLDPVSVHRDLVNEELVTQAIASVGGFGVFGQSGTTRQEQIDGETTSGVTP